MLNLKAGPFPIPFLNNLKKGIGKLACSKVDIGKILGKLITLGEQSTITG